MARLSGKNSTVKIPKQKFSNENSTVGGRIEGKSEQNVEYLQNYNRIIENYQNKNLKLKNFKNC